MDLDTTLIPGLAEVSANLDDINFDSLSAILPNFADLDPLSVLGYIKSLTLQNGQLICDVDGSLVTDNPDATDMRVIVDAAGGMSLVLCRTQCRQQHSREDGDDGNNDKEFYQSKKFAVHNIPFLLAALSVVSDDLKIRVYAPLRAENIKTFRRTRIGKSILSHLPPSPSFISTTKRWLRLH